MDNLGNSLSEITTNGSKELENNKSDSLLCGYKILLLSSIGKASNLYLPFKSQDRYRFENVDTQVDDLLYFEQHDGRWYAFCKDPAYFDDCTSEENKSIELSDCLLITMNVATSVVNLYVEKSVRDSSVYNKYSIYEKNKISIGRLSDNDIAYNNALVSRRHAVIEKKGCYWVATDLDSINGVYVNGERIKSIKLKVGDVIYILGLCIIMGIDFISINENFDNISISLSKIEKIKSKNNTTEKIEFGEDNYLFNRNPRYRKKLISKEILIESPPMSMNNGQMPLLLRMGGSMVTSGMAALSGNFTSLISSVLFPIISQKYTEKEKKTYEAKRKELYTAYLEKKQNEINEQISYEESVLKQNYPETNLILGYAFEKSKLWERRNIDDDFLKIRLGRGSLPMFSTLDFSERSFSIDEDELESKMYELAEQKNMLKDVPISSSLIDNYIIGVSGKSNKKIELIERIIYQITLLHSYDEVKIVFLGSQSDLKNYDYIKYIPHIWNDNRDFRFIATNTYEATKISEYLKLEFETNDKSRDELKEVLKRKSYYVVLALDKRVFDNVEFLKEVMLQNESMGISIISAFDGLPKECTCIYELGENEKNYIVYLHDLDSSKVEFNFDDIDKTIANRSMHAISNISLKVISQSYSLPKLVTFLEMFDVGRIEHLNILKRWSDNDPIKSLATPIGVTTDGSKFMLDLHQKYQGPHGLVAGMTGSGKSEFLLSYILSMAVNYSPNEVAFVLIDYKGGGLAGAFEDSSKNVHLPHLIGTITNLDGSTIKRSIISLESELKRRQRVFNDVKNLSDKGTMDIYSYQKLFRNNIVSEPMPHLFIISDEFAELKQQQPEFMDQLISIARIGRSLGVHLILATQKPSGVVNDQIRSNTKFRVCLKVQDKSDSNDMLQRPEAAELKETGRFYLQVGYNEFFALGQSAWSGAPYIPTDEVIVARDDSVQIVDSIGNIVSEAKPKRKNERESGTQLVQIVKYISDIAYENNINPKPLWKPLLPKKLDLNELDQTHLGADSISINLGKIDDPENQQQYAFDFDFTHCRNLLIVGEPGSGKTTLVQSILATLTEKYTPDRLNLYILDYSSRMLKVFKSLPHVGEVLCEEDNNRLDDFFELINKIIDDRKKLFSKLEVDSYESANSITPIPIVFVIIDNFSGISGNKQAEKHYYKFQDYLKDCSNYGVKYIITANSLNTMNSTIKLELNDRISLHMKDKYDYSDALGCKVDYIPDFIPGRGLYCLDERPLQFQIAQYEANIEDKQRIRYLKERNAELAELYSDYKDAVHLPVLFEDAEYVDFVKQFSNKRIALGISKKNGKTVALPLKQFSMLSIYFGNLTGVAPVTENLLYSINREKGNLIIIKRSVNSVFDETSQYNIKDSLAEETKLYESKKEVLVDLWKNLSDEMSSRNDLFTDFCNNNGLDPNQNGIERNTFDYMYENTKPIFLFIENLIDFVNALDFISAMVYDKIFSNAKLRNMYIIGCSDSNDYDREGKESLLFRSFNPDKYVVLFGGNYSKEIIVDLPKEIKENNNPIKYNTAIMKYRDSLYSLVMPCGVIEQEAIDEDYESIF